MKHELEYLRDTVSLLGISSWEYERQDIKKVLEGILSILDSLATKITTNER